MKAIKIILLSLILLGLIFSAVFAKKHLPEERGKILFTDPKAFGGVKACSECHPGGKGVEKAGDKKEFNIMGKTQKSLEEAVNFCIVNASKGKTIDEKSDKMKDIVAYIKSLKGKMMEKKSPGY
ncbi:MAG: hypothetical protein AB1632_10275 [Nitrospirota bacterium]